MYREALLRIFFGKAPIVALGVTMLIVFFGVLAGLASVGEVVNHYLD